ncbi:hypothetical protein [Frigidibacter sp. MR17.24]|uniref:hypothetical protein n=1 Tax=Frigidibacter sp. MR17.24 TaxID=3127345 RepID=UPI00301314BA
MMHTADVSRLAPAPRDTFEDGTLARCWPDEARAKPPMLGVALVILAPAGLLIWGLLAYATAVTLWPWGAM